MGLGEEMKCPECGYKFMTRTGVGFMFPKVYADTIQKGKNGDLGEEVKQFFHDHEGGTLDAESVVFCCDECGAYQNKKDLTMYVPKGLGAPNAKHGRWSVAMPFEGSEYVTSGDLKNDYVEYAKYPHKCKECGGSMHRVSRGEIFMCPKCKVPLGRVNVIHWD